jgi:chromosome segregation ATPase
MEARIAEARAKVTEADAILSKAQAQLADATEQQQRAAESVHELQDKFERDGKQRSFSLEEAATGDRHDEWFNDMFGQIIRKGGDAEAPRD